jgi:hypothetical protein
MISALSTAMVLKSAGRNNWCHPKGSLEGSVGFRKGEESADDL